MFDTPEKYRQLSHWIIRTVTSCILIYLCFRHIGSIANAVMWIIHLFQPLIIGVTLALILNVPTRAIEDILQRKTRLNKWLRPLSILLALALILGILIGVSVLVIPELVDAVQLIVQIITNGLEQLANLETNSALMETQLGQQIASLNIDWLGIKVKLENWFRSQSGVMADYAVSLISYLTSKIVTFIIGLTFSIYILAQKEKLKRQFFRLVHAWLPKTFGDYLLHVLMLSNRTFRSFIAGQTTEAIILGSLCMGGMAILRIPYAPMIGALVGVTALIPIVGAWVGLIVGTIMILTVNPFKALVFIIFLLVLQQLEGNLIYPRVVGSKINLPSIWVLAAVTIGGNLAGPLGMLLGVPAVSICYALIKEATLKRETKKHQ